MYRGDFALGTLMRFLPILTQVFLWTAVLESVEGGRVVGYTQRDMVAYYLLTMISRAFSSMPGLASGVARQIRDGEIKKFLVQPIDLLEFLLLSRVAHKLVYYAVALAPFVLVFILARGYFDGCPPAGTLACYGVSLVLAFLIGFFLELTIGLVAFWWLEISSLLFVYMLLSFFLSGHMFPLDLLGQPWRGLVEMTPLKYLAYFPSAVFLQKVTGAELARGMAIQVAWLIGFVVLSRWLYRRGLRRYSGFGG